MPKRSRLERSLRFVTRTSTYCEFQGISGPCGTSFLKVSSRQPGIMLAAHHPRWSITWLWFVRARRGFHGAEPHWQKRFGIVLAPHRAHPGIPMVVNFGLFHISLHTQKAVAKRPGAYGFSRPHWQTYAHEIALRKAKAAHDAVYRQALAQANERDAE